MKKTKQTYITTLLVACLLTGSIFLNSCSDSLDIAPPNAITDEQINEILNGNDEEKINTVLEALTSGLVDRFHATFGPAADYRYNSAQSLGAMRCLEANDIVLGNKQATTLGGWEEYNMGDFTSPATEKNLYYWQYAWDNITAANKALNYLPDDYVGDIPSRRKYQARGLVLRAYSYNYLMENYQDAYMQGGKDKPGIMLYDVYNPNQEYKPRASSVESYTFILNDAKKALASLEAAGVGVTEDKTDIDVAVAAAVLARVALCAGEWETVVEACDKVLAAYPRFISQKDYGIQNAKNDGTIYAADNNAFTNNSLNPELILGWDETKSVKIYTGWVNIFGTGHGGESPFRIDTRLFDLIADGDFRKNAFLTEDWGDYEYPPNGVKGFIPAYANTKFAAMTGIGTPTDKTLVSNVHDCMIRSSEVLLMKAEALAQQGKDSEAKEALNVLLAARTEEGATLLTCDTYPSMAGMTTLEMVKLQTRIEMWGENGLEFYNNKRWNRPVDRAASSIHLSKSSLAVKGMTLKIPENEMLYNPYVVQNE